MMTHDEAFELLAPLALDAVDNEMRNDVEAHVRECARCQSELDGFRETAAAIGNGVEPLPEGLWSSIATHLTERPHLGVTAMPVLERLAATGATVERVARAPARPRRRAMSVLVTLAAVVIALMAFNLAHANSEVSQLRGALATAREGVVVSALSTPGHRLVDLESGGVRLAQFVLVPNGNGYMVTSSMPVLGAGKTYQLWAIVNGSPVSIGLLGRTPDTVAFTISGTKGVTALAITVEPSSGSQRPSSSPIALGAIKA